MKVIRATAAVAFFVALTVASVSAQTRPAAGTGTQPRPAATPGPTAPSTVSVPDSKVALIDSSAFADEKQGIAKFVSALKRVNAEFQPRQTELQNLQQQIEKAKSDLQKAAPVQDAKVTQQQQDRIAVMETDFKRKGEDAQAAFNKRLEEVLGPIYEDIGKALDVFAKARGITLILDVTKVQGIVSAADAMDITRAFITEFNSKNPATASLTAPK
ncbi:MAG TPA: OmpH family outer membrane protein [Pyrinomonadaceae bacterium]|nr:OmpH family outer membrane protein [Pyrinomonadaceae bacterium]